MRDILLKVQSTVQKSKDLRSFEEVQSRFLRRNPHLREATPGQIHSMIEEFIEDSLDVGPSPWERKQRPKGLKLAINPEGVRAEWASAFLKEPEPLEFPFSEN